MQARDTLTSAALAGVLARDGSMLAIGLLLAAAPCAAQVVRGTVVDRGSVPLPAVVILLLNDQDSTVARTLTNSMGEFRLVVPSDGNYRITTLRIGFRPTTTAPFPVPRDGEAVRNLTVAEVPSSLDTIRVRGRNVCRVRPDSAFATYAIWEQVRTALLATQLTADADGIATRVVIYRRTLEPDKGRVLHQTQAVSSRKDARIWSSLSPDSLRKVGYVHADQRGAVTFFAPDLDALLSNAFLEDHCFRLSEQSDDGRVGIAFEPTGERRRIPEIRGTVWVDRKSAELSHLEFAYTNVARDLEAAGAGGEMRFTRLADRSWAVSSWHIRMPVVETQRMEGTRGLRQRGVETHVREVRITGGALAMVSRGSDTLWSQPTLAFRGRVVDSTSGAAVGAAWLTLGGTRLTGLTDSAGHFTITGALPGEYAIEIRTPSLDSIGTSHEVVVNFADTSQYVVLAVPRAMHVVTGWCGAKSTGTGSLVGTIARRRDSLPRWDARVVVEWNDPSAPGRGLNQRREARSGVDGRYRICELPLDVRLSVRADGDSLHADSTIVRLASSSSSFFRVMDLWLDRGADVTATFEGAVLSDVNAQPIADAEVALSEIGKNAFTDASGRFRIAGIPPGTHFVVARRLGFKQVTVQIDFAARANIERQILLSRIAVLDTVAVKASLRDQVMREFEDNRRLGLGKFWTRADLANLEGLPMSAVLSQIPGTRIVRGIIGNYAWIARSRGKLTLGGSDASAIRPDEFDGRRGAPRDCYSTVWLDNTRVYSGREEEPLFNINSITPDQIEAIEYYASPAQTPARYAALNGVCGVLVIWRRRAQ